jgi:hypothetical protein
MVMQSVGWRRALTQWVPVPFLKRLSKHTWVVASLSLSIWFVSRCLKRAWTKPWQLGVVELIEYGAFLVIFLWATIDLMSPMVRDLRRKLDDLFVLA